jgi:hypothetical protein
MRHASGEAFDDRMGASLLTDEPPAYVSGVRSFLDFRLFDDFPTWGPHQFDGERQ